MSKRRPQKPSLTRIKELVDKGGEHRPLKPRRGSKRLKVDAATLDHIAGQVRANRRKARAALLKEWQIQFAQLRARQGKKVDFDGDLSTHEPTKRELWNFGRLMVDDPHLLLREEDLAPMLFYLARAYLALASEYTDADQNPQLPLSQEEIAHLVAHVAESTKSNDAAYKRVAWMLRKDWRAVKQTYMRDKRARRKPLGDRHR